MSLRPRLPQDHFLQTRSNCHALVLVEVIHHTLHTEEAVEGCIAGVVVEEVHNIHWEGVLHISAHMVPPAYLESSPHNGNAEEQEAGFCELEAWIPPMLPRETANGGEPLRLGATLGAGGA